MRALTVAGTWITVQVLDRTIPSMPCSVLEFSLWDATCKQIPDMELSEDNIAELGPWLDKQGFEWRFGWKRKQTKEKLPETDPRQLKLFDD